MMTPTPKSTSAAVGRREWKRGRRDALVQCDRCGATATGRVNARSRLASVNLSARYVAPGRFVHADCGGRLVAYDNKDTASV